MSQLNLPLDASPQLGWPFGLSPLITPPTAEPPAAVPPTPAPNPTPTQVSAPPSPPTSPTPPTPVAHTVQVPYAPGTQPPPPVLVLPPESTPAAAGWTPPQSSAFVPPAPAPSPASAPARPMVRALDQAVLVGAGEAGELQRQMAVLQQQMSSLTAQVSQQQGIIKALQTRLDTWSGEFSNQLMSALQQGELTQAQVNVLALRCHFLYLTREGTELHLARILQERPHSPATKQAIMADLHRIDVGIQQASAQEQVLLDQLRQKNGRMADEVLTQPQTI